MAQFHYQTVMAYRIDFARELALERRRIALEQTDRTLAELADASLDVHAGVHAFRRRAKKIRALLRLFREAAPDWYERENAALRDLAREYAALRDSDVALATFERIAPELAAKLQSARLAAVHAELIEARRCRIREDTAAGELPGLKKALRKTRRRIAAWPDVCCEPRIVVAGLCKTYQRGRRALLELDDRSTGAAWHQWRKRVKYLGYQWKLLRGVWPAVIDPWWRELDRLADLLGDDHDLHQFALSFADHGAASRKLERLLEKRSLALRREAHSLGERLYAERTRCVRERLHVWLDAASR